MSKKKPVSLKRPFALFISVIMVYLTVSAVLAVRESHSRRSVSDESASRMAAAGATTVLPRDVSDVLAAGALWLPPANGERTTLVIKLRNDSNQPFRLKSARGESVTIAPGTVYQFTTRRWDRVYYVARGNPIPYLRGFHFDLG